MDLDPPRVEVVAAMASLAPDELERASRFLRDSDRRRYVTSRAALRHALSSCLEVPPIDVAFTYGERGKPSLASPWDESGIRFNVSHSDGVAMIAVTLGTDVGIDVERVRGDVDIESMMLLAFTPAERDAVSASAGPAVEFTRAWVRKEAIAKASGIGLGSGFPDSHASEGWSVIDIDAPPSYAAAAAVRGEAVVSYID